MSPAAGSTPDTSNTNSWWENTRKVMGPRVREARRRAANWALYPRDSTAPPRIVRYVLVALAIILVSAVYGVITASTSANFGPHDARYSVTIDSSITLDAGPLGSLVIDSPLPVGLGVHAAISEIPDSLTSVDSNSTLQALGQDLEGYVQFFAAPSQTISLVAKLLIEDAIKRALLAALTIVVVGIVLRYVLGYSRRRELSYRAARRTWALAAAFVVVALIAGFGFTRVAQSEANAVGGRTSTVFEGTALEGARITGRLSGVIDTYGGQLVSVYEKNENFYAAANSALNDAFDARAQQDAVDQQQLQALGVFDPPIDESDITTMVMISDLHCNVGMAPLIKTAAERSGASIILNGGDTTINGTDVERFCVQAFADAVPDGATMIQSDGNHDSATTSKQAESAGIVVLKGDIAEVDGIRFLGDSDPRETRIGQESVLVGTENYADAGNRLASVACADGANVDILLVHTPTVGVPVLESGCVPYQFSGHMHTRSGPQVIHNGVQYVNSTTAGAMLGKPSIGPLNGPSEMTILRFNTETRTMIDFQIITTTPDATVTIGPRTRYPRLTDGMLTSQTLPDGTTTLVTPDTSPDTSSQSPTDLTPKPTGTSAAQETTEQSGLPTTQEPQTTGTQAP